MSRVLIIRRLPLALSFPDKEKLLKHFGADRVWEPKKDRRNYIFASFSSHEEAKSSLSRLHQLEIGQRRLVVEFSIEGAPESSKREEQVAEESLASQKIKDFLKKLNGWNPSVDFYQPPPVNIKYKYPEITPDIIINIALSMLSHPPLYHQTMHLMNKMSLELPFEKKEENVKKFKDLFRSYFVAEIPLPASEPESEISSDEKEKTRKVLPRIVKRQHTLPKTRKRTAAVLTTASTPKAKKNKVNKKEVFEDPQLQKQKKISLVVSQDALDKQAGTSTEVVGELGKFDKEKEEEATEEPKPETEKPTVSKQELVKNRVSKSDMKLLPVFKNYHAGQTSMRLYIKNLAKNTTERDVTSIYRRYVEGLSEADQIGFDVRVMQEGRMKGQAFVTFPSEKIAETALKETNGYILNGKPMVVQFARAATANKKPIE